MFTRLDDKRTSAEEIPEAGWEARPRVSVLRGLLLFGGALIVLGLLLPAVSRCGGPGSAMRRTACLNNLKQISLGLQAYVEIYGAFPPACTSDAEGRPMHSWRTLLLPYLGEEALYRTIDLSKPWDDPVHAKARETEVGIYRCPEGLPIASTTTTAYQAVVSSGGAFPPRRSRRPSEIVDSLESTLMVIEVPRDRVVHWMSPLDADDALMMRIDPWSELGHIWGFGAAYADGRVRFLSARTSAETRWAMISVAGNDDDAVGD